MKSPKKSPTVPAASKTTKPVEKSLKFKAGATPVAAPGSRPTKTRPVEVEIDPEPVVKLQSFPQLVVAKPKPAKRENTFSKSRDTREDRGARQMKTKNSSQSFPHIR